LFDDYRTLKETITDVRKAIEKDSGFGGSSETPNVPTLPSLQLREVDGTDLEDLQGKDAIIQYLQAHDKDPKIVKLGTDEYIIWDDNILDPEWPTVKKKANWMYDSEVQKLVERLKDVVEEKFNDRFWNRPELLFHGTPKENLEIIKHEGLKAMHKTRGMSNKYIRSAVFTSTEPDWISYYYGPVVVTIQTGLMKKDGFMPMVTKEPNHTYDEVMNFIAHKIGAWDENHDESSARSEGTTDDTVIIYSSIPLKYLSFERV
jgi:hypothetical protein